MTLETWIEAELATNGLRLATDDEDAWLEPSSAGLVLATDADIPASEDLVSYARKWNRTAYISRSRTRFALPAPPPEPKAAHITPQIIYDIWRDGCAGPARVASLLRGLTASARAALEVGYWNLLRQRHTAIPLTEVRTAFELVLLWDASAMLPQSAGEDK